MDPVLQAIINEAITSAGPMSLKAILQLLVSKGTIPISADLDEDDYLEHLEAKWSRKIMEYCDKCKDQDIQPEVDFHQRFRIVTPQNYVPAYASTKVKQEMSKEKIIKKLPKHIHDNTSNDEFEDFCMLLIKQLTCTECYVGVRRQDGGRDFGGNLATPFGIIKIIGQSKRYQGNSRVSGPEMKSFIGTVNIETRATKAYLLKSDVFVVGMYITTSDFTTSKTGAIKSAQGCDHIINCINGNKLAKLLVEFGIGIIKKSNTEFDIDPRPPIKWFEKPA